MPQHIPNRVLLLLCALLCIPTFFYNLGSFAIMADEPTRAIVAMEMIFKQEYLTSTIVGDYYYKKPPLFNWILVVLFKLFGSYSEWIVRIAAVVPLLLFSWRMYRIGKKYLSNHAALLLAFINLTYGRMLFYDSFLGHIDILYAWITFESFIVLYDDAELKKPIKTFSIFYLLHGIGFMLKGLPSLVFPTFTILAWAWHQKRIRPLLNPLHFAGIFIGMLFPIVFFIAYSQQNSLYGWVEQLWDQSKQRTVIDKTWWESIQHLFTFPIDHLMHFAPWSILIVFLLRRGIISRIWQHPFLRYVLMVLICNIPVYWASPGYYPRYLFMLYPIVFMVLIEAYLTSNETRWLGVVVKVLALLLFIGFPITVYAMQWSFFTFIFLACFLLFALALAMTFRVEQANQIWILVFLLLCVRMVFNGYVLPHRTATGNMERNKQEALRVANITLGSPLYLAYPGTNSEHYHYYYIERERKEILTHKNPDTSAYFIYMPATLEGAVIDSVYFEFDMDFENLPLQVVKFKQVPSNLEAPPAKKLKWYR
jgi:4-amino-4-deoxy-L-arabinose transferase-like glycosyltransferase